MFNHTHSLTEAQSYEKHYRFHQSVESQYAKSLNEASSRHGRVFKKPFGWAHKRSSKPINLKKASAAFRRGVNLVKAMHSRQQPLGYALLDKIYGGLNEEEAQQMTDFIISTYIIINYEEASSYFGGYDKMIAAFDVISGSEYDITEDFIPEPDTAYMEMARSIQKAGYDLVKKTFLSIGSEEKVALSKYLLQTTSASPRQLARFLHMKYLKNK